MNRECKFSSHNSNDRPQSNNLLTVKPNWRTNLPRNNPTIQSTTLPSKHQINRWTIPSKHCPTNVHYLAFLNLSSVQITFRTSHICPQRSRFLPYWRQLGLVSLLFLFWGAQDVPEQNQPDWDGFCLGWEKVEGLPDEGRFLVVPPLSQELTWNKSLKLYLISFAAS